MKNRVVVPQKNEVAIADDVELLINDHNLFERLRKNARKKVEVERNVEFTEKIMVKALKEIVI